MGKLVTTFFTEVPAVVPITTADRWPTDRANLIYISPEKGFFPSCLLNFPVLFSISSSHQGQVTAMIIENCYLCVVSKSVTYFR